MNPELQRNLWLEAPLSRVIMAIGVWALVVVAASVLSRGSPLVILDAIGQVAFFVLVIILGTRNAARSVIGEVRERTWDFQRLAAIAPISMALGKLFGSTSFGWLAGGLGLVIASVSEVMGGDALASVLHSALTLVLIAVLGQATSLASALLAVRRRRADAKLGVLPHQLAGLFVVVVFNFQLVNDDLRALLQQSGVSEIAWWGIPLAMPVFILISVAIFAAWAIIASWRLMRLELMMTNTPIYWPAFLLFIAAYLVGFAPSAPFWALGASYALFYVATMVSVLVEPKNLVELRGFGAAAGRLDVPGVLARAPGYAWAYLFAVLAAVGVVLTQNFDLQLDDRLAFLSIIVPILDQIRDGMENGPGVFLLASLGFLARDVGVFHFFHANPRQTRGDFAAITTLVVIYIAGAILASSPVGGELVAGLVAPNPFGPAWLAVLPWLQAGLVWMLTAARYRQGAQGAIAPA